MPRHDLLFYKLIICIDVVLWPRHSYLGSCLRSWKGGCINQFKLFSVMERRYIKLSLIMALMEFKEMLFFWQFLLIPRLVNIGDRHRTLHKSRTPHPALQDNFKCLNTTSFPWSSTQGIKQRLDVVNKRLSIENLIRNTWIYIINRYNWNNLDLP